MNHRLQQVAEDYQPGDHLKEGIHIFVLLLVQQKYEKSKAPHISKDDSQLSVLILFFTEIFHLLEEQTNLHYQQHLDG